MLNKEKQKKATMSEAEFMSIYLHGAFIGFIVGVLVATLCMKLCS